MHLCRRERLSRHAQGRGCRPVRAGRARRAARERQATSWTSIQTTGQLDGDTEKKLKGTARQVPRALRVRAPGSMPSLKDMRARMNSVRQTRKITSAMKLVAASKLRRAQDQAEASRPFAERMTAMLQNLAAGVAGLPGRAAAAGRHRQGRGPPADRRHRRPRPVRRLQQHDRARRAPAHPGAPGRRQAGQAHHHRQEGPRHAAARPARSRSSSSSTASSASAGSSSSTRQRVTERVLELYAAGEFDVCTLIYNKFKSAVTQILTFQQLVPVPTAAGRPKAGRGQRGRRDLRVRARRGAHPERAPAAQSGGAAVRGAAGERGQRAGRADGRHGQRHPQCGRDDQQADA